MTDVEVDYDKALQANLVHVFGQRDPIKRRAAIADLYAPDAVLYEPDHVATGLEAITQTIDALITSLPPDFVFSADGPAVGHHGLARVRWRAGPPGAPPAVTGTDVAAFAAGRISTLHVFLDPPTA